MAAETGFMIDGTLHEVPSLDSLNMDEAQVLYDYSGLSIEDFASPDPDDPAAQTQEEFDTALAGKMKNPGFLRALMHIAYQRANPKIPAVRVKQMVGQEGLIRALEHLGGQEPADPLDTTNEPNKQSPPNSADSKPSSGDDSIGTSEGQVVPLATTTTPGSAMSSTSDRASSAQ